MNADDKPCYQVICYHLAIKAKHSFLVKRCLIATLELNAIHCVIYMVRRYIVLYGGKSMEGNMCDNLDNGHSVCVCVIPCKLFGC